MLDVIDSDAAPLAARAIAERGYVIVPRFLHEEAVASLRAQALTRDRDGEFSAAGVGRWEARSEQPDLRGDRICWLDAAAATPLEQGALQGLETLRQAINERTYVGLFELECHYTIYPAGARYRRHVDQLRDDDARLVSVALYLNDAWQRGDGGELMLYVDDSACAVAPQGGTLVAFLSGQFEHEVMPATRERVSLTGWFRRRETVVAPC